ncbi:hypothetical protein CROQUDRAFT_658215, partial [Cronartium quercuum f. sp. fusiforme G11]
MTPHHWGSFASCVPNWCKIKHIDTFKFKAQSTCLLKTCFETPKSTEKTILATSFCHINNRCL